MCDWKTALDQFVRLFGEWTQIRKNYPPLESHMSGYLRNFLFRCYSRPNAHEKEVVFPFSQENADSQAPVRASGIRGVAGADFAHRATCGLRFSLHSPPQRRTPHQTAKSDRHRCARCSTQKNGLRTNGVRRRAVRCRLRKVANEAPGHRRPVCRRCTTCCHHQKWASI
jgi:hypothetical protein